MCRRHLIGAFVDGDAEHAIRIGFGRAWNGALKPEERDRGAAVGQPHLVRSLGDDADASEDLSLPGDEQHSRIGAHLIPHQGDRHPREDNCVV